MESKELLLVHLPTFAFLPSLMSRSCLGLVVTVILAILLIGTALTIVIFCTFLRLENTVFGLLLLRANLSRDPHFDRLPARAEQASAWIHAQCNDALNLVMQQLSNHFIRRQSDDPHQAIAHPYGNPCARKMVNSLGKPCNSVQALASAGSLVDHYSLTLVTPNPPFPESEHTSCPSDDYLFAVGAAA